MQRSVANFFQSIMTIISTNYSPCKIQRCRPLSRSLTGSRCCHRCEAVRGIRGTHGDLLLYHGLVRDVLLRGHYGCHHVYGLRREHDVLHVRGVLRGRDHGDGGVRGLRGQHCMCLLAASRLLSVSAAAFRVA